jgi:regulator of sigma E protease
MFVLYEVVTGRKPSDKFLEHAQIVGMIILISLLILANGNDILGLIRK